uniref:Uncharacterized protein n=1 Tax=Micrurus lemniscatus lemniscatus TaxID=129467 RepID=A0A2D4HKP4_MICLE
MKREATAALRPHPVLQQQLGSPTDAHKEIRYLLNQSQSWDAEVQRFIKAAVKIACKKIRLIWDSLSSPENNLLCWKELEKCKSYYKYRRQNGEGRRLGWEAWASSQD